MSTFDKVLHIVGLLAGGVVVTAASGGAAIPAWLVLVCGIVAPVASGTAGSPFIKKAPEEKK